MKMDRPLAQIPVVICTAALQQVSELQGYLTEQGVMVIVKPFNVDQLEEAVRGAIALKEEAGGLIAAAD
jgi:CheY-like chemotaxis protein